MKQRVIRIIFLIQVGLTYPMDLFCQGESNQATEILSNSLSKSDSITEIHQRLLSNLIETSNQHLELKRKNLQKEIELLDVRNELLQQGRSNQQRLIWGGSLIFFVIIGSLYYLYRNKQKTNERLREIDQIKAKLFADISHEFRTPLTLIKGPLEVLMAQSDLPSKSYEQLALVKRNSDRLSTLVNGINDLTKLEANKMTLAVQESDLTKHLQNVAASFASLAEQKDLIFKQTLDITNKKCYYDPVHIETIINNLLSNAFKYCDQGLIHLSARINDGRAVIQVSDTGIGLSKEDQARVFDRYFRASDPTYRSEGVGIGLALAYQLATLHKGDLKVESAQGLGSNFIFSFPIRKEAYAASELQVATGQINDHPDRIETRDQKINPRQREVVHEDEPLLLLVEDNMDMHRYLTEIFDESYRILHATDGSEGLQQATELVPDLIVSDLMMPVMDGQQLLKKVRQNEKTSHIPFIMLTANQQEQAKLDGLQAGADDYLTKPFSVEEIKLKVQNLILTREQLRHKYEAEQRIPTSRLITNEAEQNFWNRLETVVRENLSNAHFSAEDFARAMHMSRMQLHRKLKALTNESANRFLRNQRLKQASTLIQNPEWSVSDVAYEVGFTSPSYFSKCFKEKYGVAPKEYVAK